MYLNNIKKHTDHVIVIHAVAFANRDDLTGTFSDTSQEGWSRQMSAYSLITISRHAKHLCQTTAHFSPHLFGR